jgi:hypothetical protein
MTATKPTLRWRKMKYDCGTRQWRARLGSLVIWVEDLGDHGDYFLYGFTARLGVASTKREAQLRMERRAYFRLRAQVASEQKALRAYLRARRAA